MRFARCVCVNGDQTWHAATFGVFAAHGVTWALGRHHDDVDAFFWLNQAKVHIQAVGERDCGAWLDVVVDVFLVCFRLKLIGHCEHNDVAPCGRFGDAHNSQALSFCFLGRRRTLAQCNGEVFCAGIAQVQSVGVALGTIAEDCDLLVLDQVHVAVAVIENAHVKSPKLVSAGGYGGLLADLRYWI